MNPCSWCFPHVAWPEHPKFSHSICDCHKAQMLSEARRKSTIVGLGMMMMALSGCSVEGYQALSREEQEVIRRAQEKGITNKEAFREWDGKVHEVMAKEGESSGNLSK